LQGIFARSTNELTPHKLNGHKWSGESQISAVRKSITNFNNIINYCYILHNKFIKKSITYMPVILRHLKAAKVSFRNTDNCFWVVKNL